MHKAARTIAWLGGVAFLAFSTSATARPGLPSQGSRFTEPPNPAYQHAKHQVESGAFEQAERTLHRALTQPDLTDGQLADLYQLLGLTELYLGHRDKARSAYEKLLQARPGYTLPPGEPPKVRALYAEIEEDIRHRRVLPVTLDAEPIPNVDGGAPVTVKAQVEDLPLGARVRLYYRRAGTQAYSAVDLERTGLDRGHLSATVAAATLPKEAHPYDVEYYFEVSDAAQRRLAGEGDAYDPLTFRVRGLGAVAASDEAAGTPWYKSPWVWIIGGAVTAGAAVGIVAAASSHPKSTLHITISVNGP